jgi:hypothetical protein
MYLPVMPLLIQPLVGALSEVRRVELRHHRRLVVHAKQLAVGLDQVLLAQSEVALVGLAVEHVVARHDARIVQRQRLLIGHRHIWVERKDVDIRGVYLDALASLVGQLGDQGCEGGTLSDTAFDHVSIKHYFLAPPHALLVLVSPSQGWGSSATQCIAAFRGCQH